MSSPHQARREGLPRRANRRGTQLQALPLPLTSGVCLILKGLCRLNFRIWQQKWHMSTVWKECEDE